MYAPSREILVPDLLQRLSVLRLDLSTLGDAREFLCSLSTVGGLPRLVHLRLGCTRTAGLGDPPLSLSQLNRSTVPALQQLTIQTQSLDPVGLDFDLPHLVELHIPLARNYWHAFDLLIDKLEARGVRLRTVSAAVGSIDADPPPSARVVRWLGTLDRFCLVLHPYWRTYYGSGPHVALVNARRVRVVEIDEFLFSAVYLDMKLALRRAAPLSGGGANVSGIWTVRLEQGECGTFDVAPMTGRHIVVLESADGVRRVLRCATYYDAAPCIRNVICIKNMRHLVVQDAAGWRALGNAFWCRHRRRRIMPFMADVQIEHLTVVLPILELKEEDGHLGSDLRRFLNGEHLHRCRVARRAQFPRLRKITLRSRQYSITEISTFDLGELLLSRVQPGAGKVELNAVGLRLIGDLSRLPSYVQVNAATLTMVFPPGTGSCQGVGAEAELEEFGLPGLFC
ncbi:hypothetical protein BKA62DRAFT_767996 [Auriculariales sp. MPI-PUGE-AT-0066]|nr:hypothetical protein BKA62DRAFT_767996 [Auriculariales sp. MPI-PUGE-AT-0066]